MKINMFDTIKMNNAFSKFREQEVDDYLDDRQDIEAEIERAENEEVENLL